MNVTRRYIRSLLKKKNVIGLGDGVKVKKGRKSKSKCITVLVERKAPMAQLSSKDLVPKKIGSVQTDVIEIGKIRAQPVSPDKHKLKYRPGIGGISIGHKEITAGTFGCVVYDGGTGQPLILSNNHVLADTNQARVGDDILQPGPTDGGKSSDRIGSLERFIPIAMDQEVSKPEQPAKCSIANFALVTANALTKTVKPHYTWQLARASSATNEVDAAVAKPSSNSVIKDEIFQIGKIKGIAPASIGQKVHKSGRTTGYTEGTVQVLNATVTVNYDTGSAVFEDQIITTAMSQGGDSGSLVLDKQNKAVGLLFAGSPQSTIMNPIGKVLEKLNVYFG